MTKRTTDWQPRPLISKISFYLARIDNLTEILCRKARAKVHIVQASLGIPDSSRLTLPLVNVIGSYGERQGLEARLDVNARNIVK